MVVWVRHINSAMNPIWCRIYMRGYIDFSVYKGYLSKKERESKFQKRTKTRIVVADAAESKRLSELRQKRRASRK